LSKKAPVPAQPAIQSDEEAGCEAQQYLDLKAEVDQLDSEEKDRVAAIKQEYSDRRAPIVAECELKWVRVQTWAESTRGDRKTIRFPNGREARWRTASSAKLIVSGTLELIIQSLLKRRDWKKFLKVELKKSSLAAHPKVVDQTEGLRLERGEYFSIK
jgi:phage host-nuclease inhibitor protein Gam